MKYCRKCGAPLPQEARFCDECGTPIGASTPPESPPAQAGNGESPVAAPVSTSDATSKPTSSHGLPLWLIISTVAVVVVAAIGIGSYLSTRCHADGCNEEAIIGDYCISHVCLHSDCESQRSKHSSRGYCYYHDSQADKEEQKAESSARTNAYRDLSISDVHIDRSYSSYSVATGTLTNNGSRTYRFVEVKGSFKNSSGEVVDTDWTYACGSEGLAPGESTTFRLSVDKQYGIESCSVSILDYD